MTVSYQMNRLSLRNNLLKLETSEELEANLEEFTEYTPNEWNQNQRMSTCNRGDLETLGYYAQTLPGHWFECRPDLT